MVTTAEALQVLYPAAVMGPSPASGDYVVTDAGIAYWSPALGPQPTPAQLAAVTDRQVSDARRAREPDLYDFADRVTTRLAEIDADLTLLAGTPTLNQVARVVRDALQWQRRLTRAVVRAMRKGGDVR